MLLLCILSSLKETLQTRKPRQGADVESNRRDQVGDGLHGADPETGAQHRRPGGYGLTGRPTGRPTGRQPGDNRETTDTA